MNRDQLIKRFEKHLKPTQPVVVAYGEIENCADPHGHKNEWFKFQTRGKWASTIDPDNGKLVTLVALETYFIAN
jgi:hypothetical protein